jgi:hypothetical protein
MEYPEVSARQYRAVVRNERLTAMAGAVLFVGFGIDLVVTANLATLIMIHIFIGALLAGPLILKLSSVGYRFVRYYGKSPAFVLRGPPNIWLRLLAPFLIGITLTLFGSGIVLALQGPAHMSRLVFLLHAGSAAIWLPLVTVHVYAHVRQVPRAIANDWRTTSAEEISGRIKRLRITVLALVVGAIGGFILTALASSWRHAHLPHVLPSPLVLGIGAAVVALFIAIPILRDSRES